MKMDKKTRDRIFKKAFDMFCRKACVTSFRVFVRFPDASMFGLNAVVSPDDSSLMSSGWSGKEKCVYINGGGLANFKMNRNLPAYIKDMRLYSVKKLPACMKIAILEECWSSKKMLVFHRLNFDEKLFIPKIRSLEELAIKIDLES